MIILLIIESNIGYALENKPNESSLTQPSSDSSNSQKLKSKQMSPREKRRKLLNYCEQFEQKLIGFYQKVFLVKDCKRIPLNHQKLSELLKKGETITKIDNEVIYLIPLLNQNNTGPISQTSFKTRCSDIEGNYITFNHETMYYIENCKKRLFPDWKTFNAHRLSPENLQAGLTVLSEQQIKQIKSGSPFSSVLPVETIQNTKKLSKANICNKYQNKFVSYYSKLYKVSNCKKRPIDSQQFTKYNNLGIKSLLQIIAKKNPNYFDSIEKIIEQYKNLTDSRHSTTIISNNTSPTQLKDINNDYTNASKDSAIKSDISSESDQSHQLSSSEIKLITDDHVKFFELTKPQIINIPAEHWMEMTISKQYELSPQHFLQPNKQLIQQLESQIEKQDSDTKSNTDDDNDT